MMQKFVKLIIVGELFSFSSSKIILKTIVVVVRINFYERVKNFIFWSFMKLVGWPEKVKKRDRKKKDEGESERARVEKKRRSLISG